MKTELFREDSLEPTAVEPKPAPKNDKLN